MKWHSGYLNLLAESLIFSCEADGVRSAFVFIFLCLSDYSCLDLINLLPIDSTLALLFTSHQFVWAKSTPSPPKTKFGASFSSSCTMIIKSGGDGGGWWLGFLIWPRLVCDALKLSGYFKF